MTVYNLHFCEINSLVVSNHFFLYIYRLMPALCDRVGYLLDSLRDSLTSAAVGFANEAAGTIDGGSKQTKNQHIHLISISEYVNVSSAGRMDWNQSNLAAAGPSSIKVTL